MDERAEGRRLLERLNIASDRPAFYAALTPEQQPLLRVVQLEEQLEIEREADAALEKAQRATAEKERRPAPKKANGPPAGKLRRSTGFSQGRVNQRRADL